MPSTELHVRAALTPGSFDGAAPARVVRRLRALTWRELALLAGSGVPTFELRIDERQVDHALRGIRDRLDHDDRVDYFIEHGATTALLRRLFRWPVPGAPRSIAGRAQTTPPAAAQTR